MGTEEIEASSFSDDVCEFIRIGLEDLARNKAASGRPKDQEDLRFLLRALEK